MMKSVKLGVLAASILQLSVLTVGLVSSEQAMAQNCTSSDGIPSMGCLSWRGGNSWIGIVGQEAKATVDITGFNFPDNPTGYPIHSTNTVLSQSSGTVNMYAPATYTGTMQAPTFEFTAMNMTYNSGNQAWHVEGTPENLLFQITMSLEGSGDQLITSTNGTYTVSGITSKNTWYRKRVILKVKAIAIGNLGTAKITLPNTQIFNLTKGNVKVGELWINGANSSFNPPPPPIPAKPATCTQSNGNKEFDLGSVAITSIMNQGSEAFETDDRHSLALTCDNRLRVDLHVSDINETGNTGTYLKNKTGTTGYAANAGVKLYYTKDNTAHEITMGQKYRIQDPVTVTQASQVATKNLTIPFHARIYNPVGNTIGVGAVQANATVTLSYQ